MNAIHRLDDKWLKATVIGAIWASVEIVFGSFLHNMRFPMAGTILSFMSVGLMVTYLRIWPLKGLIIRAGLICALMKSISPSAIILGPMTGILTEAVLMELAIGIIGLNMIGFVVGGMFGVLSALVHKTINLLILYGWDLATLFDNLVKFASRQIGWEQLQGIQVLVVLGIVYMITGAVAALVAIRVVKKVQTYTKSSGHHPGSSGENRLFSYTDPQDYSLFLLLLHILGLIGILLAINLWSFWIWIPASILYLGFTWFHYRRSFKRLLQPKMWIQLLLITLLAAIFIKGIESGRFPDPEGVKAGLLMNLRAILLLTGFSAISTELKNPVIKAILYRRGFSSLYKSISLAFSVLPEIIETFPHTNRKFKNVQASLHTLLWRSEVLYEQIRDLDECLPVCFILAGDREEGKTTFLKALIKKLEDRMIRSAGFVAQGIHNADGERTGYQIVHCSDGTSAGFCHTTGEENWERIGKFYIDPDGLLQGRRWLERKEVEDADIVVIDEMGPLELSGKGWAPSIGSMITGYPKPMIWTVRRSMVKRMARKWNLGQVIVWDVSSQEVDDAVEDVLNIFGQVPEIKET